LSGPFHVTSHAPVKGRRESVARGRRVDHFILWVIEWMERGCRLDEKVDNHKTKSRSSWARPPFLMRSIPPSRFLQSRFLISPNLEARCADPRIRDKEPVSIMEAPKPPSLADCRNFEGRIDSPVSAIGILFNSIARIICEYL
jgi:hypothetical protein